MPRGRGVRRGAGQGQRILRGRVVNQAPEPAVARRRRRNDEQEVPAQPAQPAQDIQQAEVAVPPPPKQYKDSSAQADQSVINGEDLVTCISQTPMNNDPMLLTCNNETDIFLSKSMKDKIWNLEYVDLALLLRQNFNFQNEKQNYISLEDGKLVMHPTSKPSKVKQIDSIEIWTDAFINYAKVIIERHPLLASDLYSYMSIIRGASTDAPFSRVYMYDQQFRLRISVNQTRSWSQIDGNLWLRFIAKGALGSQSVSQQRPCYDYNFKKSCFRYNCIYKHTCFKCGGFHPAVICGNFRQMQYQPEGKKQVSKTMPFIRYPPPIQNGINTRPPLLPGVRFTR